MMARRGRIAHLAVLLAAALPAVAQNPRYTNMLAPYVASPQRVVDRMLELANLKPGEKLYDLGAGDGRIVITAAQRYNVKAVGVEISDKLVRSADDMIDRLGLQQRASMIHADIFDVDFSDADVVTIFLATQSNEKLRPRLEKLLKPGALVISHDFAVPGWKPKLVDKAEDHHRHAIYVYQMPPTKE